MVRNAATGARRDYSRQAPGDLRLQQFHATDLGGDPALVGEIHRHMEQASVVRRHSSSGRDPE
ncbi:MAG: hypothetical protein ACM3ZA_07640 [Bacillota bacterium]